MFRSVVPYSQNSIVSLRELLSKVQEYLGGSEGMLSHKMLNVRATQVSYETVLSHCCPLSKALLIILSVVMCGHISVHQRWQMCEQLWWQVGEGRMLEIVDIDM